MEKLKKIGGMAIIGFAIGWMVVGVYVLIFPPQGAVFGGPSTFTFMSYGGFVGLFMGAVRGLWSINTPDSE